MNSKAEMSNWGQVDTTSMYLCTNESLAFMQEFEIKWQYRLVRIK